MAKKTTTDSEKTPKRPRKSTGGTTAAKKSSKASGAAKSAKKKSTKKTTKKAAKKAAKKAPSASRKTTKKATAKKTAGKKASKKTATKAPKKAAAKTTKKASKKTTRKSAKKTEKKASKTVAGKTASKKRGAESPAERALAAPGRRGQVAAEKARYQSSSHAPVLREELGELPPGYGLSIVRAWIRDPRHLVIVWDINDPEMIETAERLGWSAVGVRVIDEAGVIVSDLHVGTRSGIHHLELPGPGLSLRMALGLHREDGFFETLALSGPVRTPPEGPSADEGEYHTIRLEDDLDRRLLAEHEPPPRPGHRAPSALSPGARVRARLELAYRSAVGSVEDPTLIACIRHALDAGEGPAREQAGLPGGPEDAAGERPELRKESERSHESEGREPAGAGVSSEDLAGRPSSHSRPGSHSRPTSPGASRR